MIAKMINNNELPPSANNLLVTTPRTSIFYLLPKIHKPGNPGRLIVSACSCPTENVAAFLYKIFAPLVCNLQTYVKDIKHALRIFHEFCLGDWQRFLFTMDIKSLPSTQLSLTMVFVPLHISLTSENSKKLRPLPSMVSQWTAKWAQITPVCWLVLLKT